MNTKDIFKSEIGRKEVLDYYNEMLNKYSDNNRQYYINTRHGKTFVIEAGEKTAQPIIFLHGSGMSSFMWIKELIEYSKKYRVFAVDILGEPGKSEGNRLPLVGKFHSEWLLDIYESLNINKSNVVGISLGGWIAIKFATDYPKMVEKVVLISPSGIGNQKNHLSLSIYFIKLLVKKE